MEHAKILIFESSSHKINCLQAFIDYIRGLVLKFCYKLILQNILPYRPFNYIDFFLGDFV